MLKLLAIIAQFGGDMNSLEEISFNCPYCGESMTTLIDISAGNQQYIEDCQVCCCPIVFDIMLSANGEIQQVLTRRENE